MLVVRDNFKILYSQINFPAYKDYLFSNSKWFNSHAKMFGEKRLKGNDGAYCFLYSCFFNKFQFTCDLHDALNQTDNSSFDFSLEAILLPFFKNRIF